MPITSEQAAAIALAIVADLTNRSGLRQTWEGIDDHIQQEIIERWQNIIRAMID